MKKLLVLLSAIVAVFTLSGCEILAKGEMALALDAMDRLESYRMDITLELQGEEFMTSHMFVVGNYQEMHVMGVSEGTFIIDDTFYILEEWNGLPRLQEFTDIEDEDYDNFDLFGDYEFVEDEEGYYVLEGESDLFEGVYTIKFFLEDGKIKEMILLGEMELLGETYTMDVIIEYSLYNEVDIDVPTYITDLEIGIMEAYIEEFGVNSIVRHENGFSINGDVVIDCLDGLCFIEAEPVVEYNIETMEAKLQESETWENYETFADSLGSEDLTKEYFEFVNYVEEILEKYN